MPSSARLRRLVRPLDRQGWLIATAGDKDFKETRILRLAFTLSLNTNPLVNRFAEPDDLIDTVAHGIGMRDLQLTHEFINPGWPAPPSASSCGSFAARWRGPACG